MSDYTDCSVGKPPRMINDDTTNSPTPKFNARFASNSAFPSSSPPILGHPRCARPADGGPQSASASLILLTSASVGAAFGFLFALPRILTKDDAPKATAASGDTTTTQALRKRLLGSNTNLERVSDWLTTMICRGRFDANRRHRRRVVSFPPLSVRHG